MIALIQRVSSARVDVEQECIASIGHGIVALLAVQKNDTEKQVKRMCQRVMNYRIFPDNAGKMNLSLIEKQGGLILVPQFTLIADTSRGNRPSFSDNIDPKFGEQLFELLISHAKQEYNKVQHGVFGADMQVTLTNDGPVTFWLQV